MNRIDRYHFDEHDDQLFEVKPAYLFIVRICRKYSEGVSEWLVSNTKWDLVQIYHGENTGADPAGGAPGARPP